VFASKKTVYELSLVLLELTEKFVESEAANEQYRNSAEERLANLREWAEYQNVVNTAAHATMESVLNYQNELAASIVALKEEVEALRSIILLGREKKSDGNEAA